MFSDHQIQLLLDQKPITASHPWSSNNEEIIHKHYKEVCEEMASKLGLSSKIEWDHYGSGYASFIDAWFYRPTIQFAAPYKGSPGESYFGCAVLFSRLSPFYVLMEGAKAWGPKGGGGYLPCFEAVDEFDTTAVRMLAAEIEPFLRQKGLERLHRHHLSADLPPEIEVPTILCDPPYHQFDALFHWMD
ncbi:MAG: hypothetical protein U0800_16295 [Isosphaeraceae bacterium]